MNSIKTMVRTINVGDIYQDNSYHEYFYRIRCMETILKTDGTINSYRVIVYKAHFLQLLDNSCGRMTEYLYPEQFDDFVLISKAPHLGDDAAERM